MYTSKCCGNTKLTIFIDVGKIQKKHKIQVRQGPTFPAACQRRRRRRSDGDGRNEHDHYDHEHMQAASARERVHSQAQFFFQSDDIMRCGACGVMRVRQGRAALLRRVRCFPMGNDAPLAACRLSGALVHSSELSQHAYRQDCSRGPLHGGRVTRPETT